MEAEKGAEKGGNEVMSLMDNAKVSLFHFKAIVVAGAGFFTDAYDLFSIGLLTKIIGRVYYQDVPFEYSDFVGPGSLPINLDAAVSGVALCGTLAGQLFFGRLGDIFGRKSVYGIVLAIMIISAICQSMSFGRNNRAVIGTLCWWRFFLGFGVGGDYPLSATIMSEYSSRLSRGAFVSAVFAQQGTGILTAAAVSIIVTSCFRAYFPAGPFPDRNLVLAHMPLGGFNQETLLNCPPFMSLMNGVVVYQSANLGSAYISAQQAAITAAGGIAPSVPYLGSLAPGFDPVGMSGAGTATAGAGAVAYNSYQSWPAQWYPVVSGANTFCNPQLYANKTVVCPFKISLMTQQALSSSAFINNTMPLYAWNNGQATRGALVNSNGPSVIAQPTSITPVPANPNAANYWLAQFPNCINFMVFASNGMVRVNEESGAPKALDWPQVNAISQAYYWQLVQASVPMQCDWVWRIVLLFGFFPASCTMYIRATFPETPRFTLHKEGNLEKLAKDMASVSGQEMDATHTVTAHGKEITFGMFMRRHGVELLGCAMCWCLLDVAFYSQGLFQKDIFTQINWLPGAAAMNALTETFKIARAQALIALGSTIPGYWFTVATVDYLGRLKIQLVGFVLMTAFMAGLCGGYYQLLDRSGSKATSLSPTVGVNGFVVLYALTFFFANFGPNATTFVIPSELFPTVWKTTAHGFSAACGKAGAIIGAFGFLYSSKPVFGEYAWAANYGGPGWWSWTWKPNCPGGLGSKSFAGNGWDPLAPLVWGPCVHHPNKIWFNGTQNYKFLNPTNMSGVLCAAGVLGCNDITGYRSDGYPNWATNPYANVPLPVYQLAQMPISSGLLSLPINTTFMTGANPAPTVQNMPGMAPYFAVAAANVAAMAGMANFTTSPAITSSLVSQIMGGALQVNIQNILNTNAVIGYQVGGSNGASAAVSTASTGLASSTAAGNITIALPATGLTAWPSTGTVNTMTPPALTGSYTSSVAYVQTTVTTTPAMVFSTTAGVVPMMTTFAQNKAWDNIIPYSVVAQHCLAPGPNVLPTKAQSTGTILCQYGQHTGYQGWLAAQTVATTVSRGTPNYDIFSYSTTAYTPCNAAGSLLPGLYNISVLPAAGAAATNPAVSSFVGQAGVAGAGYTAPTPIGAGGYALCNGALYTPGSGVTTSTAQNWWGNNRSTLFGGFGVISSTWSNQPLPTPQAQYYPYGVGLQASLGILAGTNFLGMLFTFVLPETNGKTLEELSGETENPDA